MLHALFDILISWINIKHIMNKQIHVISIYLLAFQHYQRLQIFPIPIKVFDFTWLWVWMRLQSDLNFLLDQGVHSRDMKRILIVNSLSYSYRQNTNIHTYADWTHTWHSIPKGNTHSPKNGCREIFNRPIFPQKPTIWQKIPNLSMSFIFSFLLLSSLSFSFTLENCLCFIWWFELWWSPRFGLMSTKHTFFLCSLK